MSAAAAVRQVQTARATELANALDIALCEHARRYGIRFECTGVTATKTGVKFEVEVAR